MSKINENEIKKRFEAVSKFEISPDVTARDLEKVSKNLTELTSEQKKSGHNIWKIIMKSKITKFATAASIIIAVLIAIHYFGGSIDGTSIVWADVMEQLNSFRPYASTHTVYDEGRQTWGFRLLRMNLSQRRQIFPDGRIAVYDLSIPKSLTIYPEEKRAIERELSGNPTSDPDMFAIARSMQGGSLQGNVIQELGIKELEGHVTKGFRSERQYDDITVWADVKTKLPVQLEIIHVGAGRRIVINEFEFDVDFDESLFSTTAPDGYSVEKTSKEEMEKLMEMTKNNTEEDLVEGLRSLAVILEGTFPPDIELTVMQTAVRGYVAEKNLSDEEAEELLTPFVESIRRAYMYMEQLKGITKFNYVGDGVKLGDSEKPVMWWLPKDSATYRVIYGDLSVADVAPENLPK
ncbi:MAG: hypothetical protein JXA96_04240 [Sedimentisphaerales bacterium]|nr:hypothetical protein [Sedimentisphaerales bacterium]